MEKIDVKRTLKISGAKVHDVGYRAFLLEADVLSPSQKVYTLSTGAAVIPDTPPKFEAGRKAGS